MVGLLLHIHDQTFPPILYNIGNLKDSKQHLDTVVIGTIDIPNDATPVIISYPIANA